MRMFTVIKQPLLARAYQQFNESGHMKPSSYFDRIVNGVEELVRLTVLLPPHHRI